MLAPKGDPSTAPYRRHEKGLLRPDEQPGFRTTTGKVELYCTNFEKYGLDPLPYHKEPFESPIKHSGDLEGLSADHDHRSA